MKPVLIVCGAGYVAGKEIMTLELARGLARCGRQVSVAISSWSDGDFARRLKEAELPAHVLPLGFISATLTRRCLSMTLGQLRRWPELLAGYSRLLEQVRPGKVIHTNWHHLLLLLPKLRPERDLYWVHELFPDRPQYRRAFGLIGGRTGGFICVSNAAADSLRRIGIADGRIRVVHNGITDLASAAPSEVCGPDRFRIGIVGQIGAWKGHDDLLEAFALVSGRHRCAELHIIGSGDEQYRAELMRRAIELGVAERIEWRGFVEDRRSAYESLDVCVTPSRFADPLPTAAIEAGFFGKPAIATRRGGLPEIIEDGVNGLLVEAGRPAEIAGALFRLIEQPQLRSALARRARSRAVEAFGHERFIREFRTLLNDETAI